MANSNSKKSLKIALRIFRNICLSAMAAPIIASSIMLFVHHDLPNISEFLLMYRDILGFGQQPLPAWIFVIACYLLYLATHKAYLYTFKTINKLKIARALTGSMMIGMMVALLYLHHLRTIGKLSPQRITWDGIDTNGFMTGGSRIIAWTAGQYELPSYIFTLLVDSLFLSVILFIVFHVAIKHQFTNAT